MKILAINPGLSSSAGYFEDGNPIICIQEERLTRIKNDSGFPKKTINYILNKVDCSPEQIDVVVLTNARYLHTSKEIYYGNYDRYFDMSSERIVEPHTTKGKIKDSVRGSLIEGVYRSIKPSAKSNEIREDADVKELEEMGFSSEKIFREDHHTCHAAAAYYGMGEELEEEYLVFTLDGGGDSYKDKVFKGVNGQLTELSGTSTYSIGNIYSAVTYLLGFNPHEHEYKLMGLAPYVNEQYREKYRAFFAQFLTLDESGLNFHNPEKLNHAQFFTLLRKNLTRDRFDNIAAGLQAFCEEIVLKWIVNNVRHYGIKKILCSGGVFMNVKLNKLLSQHADIELVNVFPSCGDETNVFGGAFLRLNRDSEQKQVNLLKEFTVGTTPGADLADALKKFEAEVEYHTKEHINKYVASELADNKIVARCSGRMEFGARALGNRSIMANPSNLRNVSKINQAVKKRDFWMPFAPAMLEDRLEELVDVPHAIPKGGSPYMMFAFDTKVENRENIICGVHQADFTARAQTINKTRYPDFYEIIEEFDKITGIPCVLNTSFNLHGFPIVENSEQAIQVLLKSKIDTLIIDNHVIRRKG